MNTVHVHAPRPVESKLHRIDCPTCERRTYAVSFFVEWYGWGTTCLKCGDQWEDGEMCPRSFRPRWRPKNIAAAKKRFRAIMATPTEENDG